MENNTKVVWKWFWVWDFEKEEAWLNRMAQAGWTLESFAWTRYRFRKTEPGEYTIRLDLHRYDEDYLAFMEETGVEYVCRWFLWIYFRKRTDKGAFELFSDLDSRIAYLRRIERFILPFMILNLGIGIMNSVLPSQMGWINLLCAALMSYALGRIRGKRDEMEKQRALTE